MSPVEAAGVGGVRHSWLAASRSRTDLRLSLTIGLHAHKPVKTVEAPFVHTASGMSCLRGCAESPAAAQFSELELLIEWPDKPQKEFVTAPGAAGTAHFSGRQPPLGFPALRQLSVRFLPPAEWFTRHCGQGSELADLTADLLGALLRGCPQ